MPHIHLDFPESGVIRRPIFSLIGWYALDVSPTTLRMGLDGEPITIQRVDRPDVRAAFPESVTDGFSTVVDLVSLQPESTSSACHLALHVDGQEIATHALSIDADVRRRVRTTAAWPAWPPRWS